MTEGLDPPTEPLQAMADPVIERVISWAKRTPGIRAVIVTSSRARPDETPDEYSDWDVVLAVADPSAWAEGNLRWQEELGTRLLGWGDEDQMLGHRTFFRGVVYDNHTRIDFSLWPVALLDAIGQAGSLPDELDDGYRILLDRDGLTAAWPAASFSAYILQPPTADEYRALVEEFWWNMSYLPKSLHRGDLFFLNSWMLEHDMKMLCLRRVLEWRIAAANGWAWAPSPYGRGLERYLDEETRQGLRGTYAGLDADAIWDAALTLAELFRRVARDVATALAYTYPAEIDTRMMEYLERTRRAGSK